MVDSIGTDEFGVFCTALGKATRLGHTDTVTLLLMRNAQPDLKDKNGDTPLKHAATNGHLLIAQILLEHGASMEEVDPESAELLHLYFSDSQPSETTSKDLLLASAAEFEQFKKDEKLAQKLQQQYNKEQHVEAQYPVINEGISEPIEDKNKRLIHACGVGDVDAVAKLINDGADVDCVSQDENKVLYTPLGKASREGHSEVVSLLLEERADVNLRDDVGETALHCAISNSHLHTAHILMRHGANLDMQNKNGRTALHYACLRGDLEAVQSLVDHGASVDLHGKDSATPLGEAASMDHTEVVQLLVNHGADIHCTDKDGWTALHWACSGGNLTVTLALLEHGANVNSQAMDSWTPLHLALSVKNTAVVQAILDHQPDIDIQDCNGLTAVMIAAEWGSSLIMKQLIVEHNANLNLQNNLGDTAVIIATLTNGAAVLRCLVEAGADVNIQNEEDLTALMIAAKNGRTDIADILLSGNCDVDIQETVTGWSAIFFAAKDGNTALANLLLKAGANVLLKDKNDVTAVDIASIHSQEVHELLTQHMPKQVTGAQPQPQSLVPSRTERTLGLLNLVNRSGQSITSLFVRLNKRLKSVKKKQRKAMIMKGREQEGHHVYRAHQEEQEGVRDQEKEGDPQRETL
jgi:ankyrin repeat protein